MASGSKKLRVLAVDDSAVMREILRRLFLAHAEDTLSGLPVMELCAVVSDGFEALEAVERLRPDAIVLDLEMPRMDGLGLLARLRMDAPGIPVLICSSLTERGAKATLEALALGAKDYVMKPALRGSGADAVESLRQQLLPKLAALMAVRGAANLPEVYVPQALGFEARVEVVVIGVSTGGPSALEVMLPMLPRDFPVPILIVQHMPKLFTAALAERLNRVSKLPIKQAEEGALAIPGIVWLAPGDAHLEVGIGSYGVILPGMLHLHQQAALNSCKPSVDYLFQSAARLYGAGTLALVMTGMGSDGLDGAREVKRLGGKVLAQDEASSAVWGMPGRVVETGVADTVLPLQELAGALVQRAQQQRGVYVQPAALRRMEVQHGLL